MQKKHYIYTVYVDLILITEYYSSLCLDMWRASTWQGPVRRATVDGSLARTNHVRKWRSPSEAVRRSTH
jgi:hypothetical protein